MKIERNIRVLSAAVLVLWTSFLFGSDSTAIPVTQKASPEAKALLKLFYDISGKYTLTGQHNYPDTRDRNTQFAAKYTGKTPAVFSADWGFSRDGDKDSYLARPDIVEEVIRQHRLGSIITICWHAVPPTADEPVTFQPLPGKSAPPESLATVQGQILDGQFQDVLTPGTRLYKHWCAQVDTIAYFLKKLQKAHVPVLWRPYHEMNGSWFWWGGRRGKYSTSALYRQMFDRFTKHHKLDNLIWIWSVDRPNKPEMQFSFYCPGSEFLDIVAIDIYGGDFNPSYHDSMTALAKGKPIVLGEVGNPPMPEILARQPNWTYYVIWAGMVRNTLKKQFKVLVNDPRMLSLEDPAYWEATASYRKACGLPVLPLEGTKPASRKVDFSGDWIFDEDLSILENMDRSFLPDQINVVQSGNNLTMQKTYVSEFADDRITEEKLTLDGKETRSEFMNSPRTIAVRWSEKGDTLFVESKVTISGGGRTSEMNVNETWSLTEEGKGLTIRQLSKSVMGKRNITLVYQKQ